MNGSQRQDARAIITTLLTILLLPTVQTCKSAAPPGFQGPGALHLVTIQPTLDQAGSTRLRVQVLGLTTREVERLQQSNRSREEWERVLAVVSGQPGSTSNSTLPPMTGSYRVESGTLVFESEFAIEPATEYRASFDPQSITNDSGEPIISVYQSPSRDQTPTTSVTQIFPTAELVPENLLKFYVQFSASMSRGHIYDHIHLRDGLGNEIKLPFLEIDEELWDPQMTRLTLIIDPGRIKRGVRPLEEVGPVLEAGKSYTLTIDNGWKDGSGVPLKESFVKSFKAGRADREPVDPSTWRIEAPAINTTGPLLVSFPEPLDSAVAPRSIRVIGQNGTLNGRVSLEDQERRWSFVPESVWKPGAYKIVIETTIEDLAGNNIGKPFDVDKLEIKKGKAGAQATELRFEVK